MKYYRITFNNNITRCISAINIEQAKEILKDKIKVPVKIKLIKEISCIN